MHFQISDRVVEKLTKGTFPLILLGFNLIGRRIRVMGL